MWCTLKNVTNQRNLQTKTHRINTLSLAINDYKKQNRNTNLENTMKVESRISDTAHKHTMQMQFPYPPFCKYNTPPQYPMINKLQTNNTIIIN